MMGVGAFVYAACHISLYVADQMFDLWKVASEIALRLYLTIGFTALLGLAALAATSTDGMVRRLGGRRWQRLHNIIYGIGLLALIHYFQQTKADVSVPTFVAGLFGWMIGYRLLIKFRNDARRAAGLDAAGAQRRRRRRSPSSPRRSASASCSTFRRSGCCNRRSISTISARSGPAGWCWARG